MRQYFAEGFFSLIKVFPMALIAYAVIFFLIWIIKNRKPQINLIPRYICEFLFVLWCYEILNITGNIGMTFCNVPSFDDFIYLFTTPPFVGAVFTMVLLNFLLFIPFGFLLPIAIKSEKWRFYKALLVGAVFSLVIEITQIFTGRFFELDDIISNTLGVLAGYFIWRSVHEICANKKILKGLSGIALTVLISIGVFWGISFITNIGVVSERISDEYSEIEDYDNCFGEVKLIRISVNGIQKAVTDLKHLKQEEYFNYWNIYSSLGLEISNNIWAAEVEDAEITSDKIINEMKLPVVEIVYDSPQNFKLYDEDLVMDNVGCIVFNIYTGDFWFGADENNLTAEVFYASTQYPYTASEKLINLINEVLK